MLRTVHRAIRATALGSQQSFSNSNTSSSKRPTIKIKNICSSSSVNSLDLIDEFDWESVGDSDDDDDDQFERDNGFFDDSVPSSDEVHLAVSSLQQVLGTSSFHIKNRPHCYLDSDAGDQIHSPTRSTHRVYSSDSELDWLEPPLHLCNFRTSESCRSDQVYDAFHLLKTDPSVQRMVISLSSDKAVWEAVMNNEVVREIRQSLTEVTNSVTLSSKEASDSASVARGVLSWIFVNTKSKYIDIIEKIKSLVNELFQHRVDENTIEVFSDLFEKRVRASFMVSVVVLLIVVVGRARRA